MKNTCCLLLYQYFFTSLKLQQHGFNAHLKEIKGIYEIKSQNSQDKIFVPASLGGAWSLLRDSFMFNKHPIIFVEGQFYVQ